MKKIVFVTRVLVSGGAEMVLKQIIDACAGRGMECLVLTTWENKQDAFLHPAVRVVELDQVSGGLKGKLRQYGQVRSLIREFGADVVLSMPEDIGIYVALAMLGTKIPVVVSERNDPWVMPNKIISRILRRVAYPFTRGLIFQTEKAASFFPQSQRKKGIILPNPLDLSRLPEPYSGPREKTVVGAGRLDDQKNFPLLIRAFGQFHKEHADYKLVIYGEGRKRDDLEALAAQILPEGSWSMPGRVPDLPYRISCSAIFALSSDYEGVPNVLIEAMAVGTPAVSTDCAPGGAASLISSRENGILVPIGDEMALAQGLSFLVDHPAEATAIAQKALAVRKSLDAKTIIPRWLAYLEKCAKQ